MLASSMRSISAPASACPIGALLVYFSNLDTYRCAIKRGALRL